MFAWLSWFDRRKRLRRDDDLKSRMREVIAESHKTSLESMEKLKQWHLPERRTQVMPVEFERRKA